jgi:transposase, IS5 family
MLVKQRTGWGHEPLVREVSDSLHLRRFCLPGLTDRVPDESTVRRLVHRLGPEVVAELTRVVIGTARRETRFRARAVRIDSTVVEADIRYPSDGVLALQAARALAREGRRLAGRLRDRPCGWSTGPGGSAGWCGRSPRRWRGAPGSASARCWPCTRQPGRPCPLDPRGQSTGRPGDGVGAGRGRQAARRPPPGRAGRPLPAHRHPDPAAYARGEDHQPAGVGERPRRPPIRKGKLGKPDEFGYVAQLAEVTAHTRRGARGYVLPAATAPGNPTEDQLLAQTAAELTRLGLAPREVALDGFMPGPTTHTLAPLPLERLFIAGRAEPGSRRTRKRLARYRTGAEGRIGHLKRGYGLRRSRLKGHEGQRIWTGWAILAYNLDTLARHTT